MKSNLLEARNLTFLLTVIFDLTIAIEIGLLIAMLLFMRRVAETTRVSVATDVINLTEENETRQPREERLTIPRGVEVYEIDGPFFFGIANKFDDIMNRMGDKSSGCARCPSWTRRACTTSRASSASPRPRAYRWSSRASTSGCAACSRNRK